LVQAGSEAEQEQHQYQGSGYTRHAQGKLQRLIEETGTNKGNTGTTFHFIFLIHGVLTLMLALMQPGDQGICAYCTIGQMNGSVRKFVKERGGGISILGAER
jgi:hypothetical protein